MPYHLSMSPYQGNEFIYKNDLAAKMFLKNRRRDLEDIGGSLFNGSTWESQFNEAYVSRQEFLEKVREEFHIALKVIEGLKTENNVYKVIMDKAKK